MKKVVIQKILANISRIVKNKMIFLECYKNYKILNVFVRYIYNLSYDIILCFIRLQNNVPDWDLYPTKHRLTLSVYT